VAGSGEGCIGSVLRWDGCLREIRGGIDPIAGQRFALIPETLLEIARYACVCSRR
jgi:hypothetical protein